MAIKDSTNQEVISNEAHWKKRLLKNENSPEYVKTSTSTNLIKNVTTNEHTEQIAMVSFFFFIVTMFEYYLFFYL